jgi:glycosyltransferase involved in cell wall biosynthesis
MHPYTLIQLGMHSDASDGGVDRYFWGLNKVFEKASADLDTRRFFFEKGTSQKASGALGRADLPLRERLLLLRKRIIRSPQYDPCRSVLASHFALYALPVLQRNSTLTHVVHFHGPWAEESSLSDQGMLRIFAKKTLEHVVYRTADVFITLSNAFRDLLIANYGVAPGKIHVIPGAIDTSQFQPADRVRARDLLGWPQEQRIIFSIRRLVERTGLHALIAAFASVATKYPDVSLFIGGKGPLQEVLRTQIRSLGLEHRIRVLGFVRESLLATHYQAANISIVPSQSLEGFGLTTLESLACGIPVLVTPVGGLPEVVGRLAPSCVLCGCSPSEIAEGLDAYLGGKMPVPAASDCVAYVKKHFIWETVAKKVLAIYDEAFRAKHAGLWNRPQGIAVGTSSGLYNDFSLTPPIERRVC